MAKNDQDSMSRSQRKKNKPKKKSNKTGLFKKIILGFFGLILLAIVAGGGLFAFYASSAPELTQKDLEGTYASDFLDINENVFYTLGGIEREFASFDDYPEVMTDAIMAIEDQRFLSHIGIDPIGIGRAAVGYVVNREIVGGGSTITQQLVKNSVFSTLEEDQTLKRKAQEAWLAIKLEQELSKEQIITLYLNKIHMGGNIYGVATAAEEYFGKNIQDLELHEAALLAGMPRAPNYYNPFVNEEAAKNRRDTVLYAMVDSGAITEQQAEESSQIPVTEGLQEQTQDGFSQVVEAYVTAVIEEIQEKTDFDPANAGLTVYTNYDPNAQQTLYDVVNSDEYVNITNENIQTAVTLMDSTTGKVNAVIGGRNQEGERLKNRAYQKNRGIGSTIKPLSTYAPAIEFLQYSTYHQLYDEPYELSDWDVNNWDNRYVGQISMRDALVDSRNIPTANLFNDDLDSYKGEIQNFLNSMGIDIETLTENNNSLLDQNAINGFMSPMQLTGAFGAFANNGNYTEPYLVERIVTQSGEEYNLTPETNRVMEEYTAYMVNDMLKDVVSYYGTSLPISGYIHAAKTGTTNFTPEELAANNVTVPADGVPDNWVVGYSPYYTMAVWVGFDRLDIQGNYLTNADGSRGVARDIYRESMSRLVNGFEQRDWQRPDSVVELEIEDGTDPAQLAAPRSNNTVRELFVRGNEPTERAEPEILELPAPSGLTARYLAATDDVTITWNAFNPDEDLDDPIEYVLTVNDEEHIISGTEHLISEPPRGVVEISLAIHVGEDTGPTSSVTIVVPEEEEEEEEPEEPEQPEEPEEPTEPEEPGNGEEETPPDETTNPEETPPDEEETPPDNEAPPEEAENNSDNNESG